MMGSRVVLKVQVSRAAAKSTGKVDELVWVRDSDELEVWLRMFPSRREYQGEAKEA